MKRVIIFAIPLFFILPSLTCKGQSSEQGPGFKKELVKERQNKNDDFVSSAQSPLDDADKPGFKGLNYFKPSSSWVINARIEKFKTPDTIQMRTTTERLPLYIVYGKANFKINGKNHELTVFRNVGLMNKPGYENYLFIPFTDETTGNQTYGGGRYIDARDNGTGFLTIDFNRAYNPYCVYNKKYSCPIPPSGNHLTIKVNAGEKLFRKK
jgi:uncharacterized protein (DUF1684 family)